MKKTYLFTVSLACVLLAACHEQPADTARLSRRSPIEEPYAYVSGGSMSGPAVPESPDPLVRYVWDHPQADDSLQIFIMSPRSVEVLSGSESFEGLHTITGETCKLCVTGEGELLFDFGTEMPAWIEIDSPDLSGDIELGISEYRGPEPLGEPYRKIRKPVCYGNTYRLELNKELYEGVRYAFLYVRKFERPFNITAVRAVCQVKPTNYTGRFHSDNDMLNRIWYTGAWDVKANLRQDCFGAILIDRSDRFSWTGDAYPAQAASLVAFSNYDAVLKNLHWTESHPNNIETYELYWVESLLDYYMYSGDEQGLRDLLPRAMKRLDHAWDIFDNPTGLSFIGWDQRLGTGFDHPNCEEGRWTFRMLAIGAWKHTARVLRMIGEEQQAAMLEERARVKAALVSGPETLSKLGMHASADAINADLLPHPDPLYHADLSDRVRRLSYSPFNQYFLLKAMAHAGHYDDAIASVFDQWGEQIRLGATCFLEVYRPDWNQLLGQNAPLPYTQCGVTSMAHPWGAGVTAWLSEEVLGIRPTSGGFRTFSVKPHFAGAATRVSGQTMTPHGPVQVSFNLATGRHTLSVPEGTEATLYIPKEGMQVSEFTINGSRPQEYTQDEEFVCAGRLKPGTYDIRVKYEGTPHPQRQEERVYATHVASLDRDTHGQWYKRYGSQGRYIVGGADDGSDLVQLPDYVESVSFNAGETERQEQFRTTTVTPLDPRAMLPVSSQPDARRVMGCYYSRGLRMMPLEVRLREEGTPYRLAVYYADCDHGKRDFVVDIFDLETLNQIAPSVRINDMSGGVYMVFECDRSVRVTANHITGDNALVNAIFFDPVLPLSRTGPTDTLNSEGVREVYRRSKGGLSEVYAHVSV